MRRVLLRLRAIFGRRALENDMQEEMRAHLERTTERLIARGLSPADARIAARREFGNVAVIQEDAREARGARWVESLAADLRFAFRYFVRTPLTTTTIILVLALGIGVNSALFSVIQAFTMRPAPAVPKDDAHVRIHGLERAAQGAPWQLRDFSYPELLELASRNETFSAVAGWIVDDVITDRRDGSGPHALRAEFVTPNFWTTLGVALVSGPGFASPLADTPDLAAVVAFTLAEELFGQIPDAIGRVLVINDVAVRIVGVAPPRFQGAIPSSGQPVLWLPISARAEIAGMSPAWLGSPDSARFSVFARLAPSVTEQQATAIASSVAARTTLDATQRPGLARTAQVLPMRGAPPATTPDDPLVVFTAIGLIALLILLVACTNVSSLLVAAAVGRRHEIAVRLSLGASRGRLVRQLLTESALLAVAGGAAGLLLYWWITRLIAAQLRNLEITPDLVTVAFTMVFALGTGVLFGLSPALHATRGGVATALRDSGAGVTRRSRLQRTFVVAQIVFSQPLLVILAILLAATVGEGEAFPDDSVSDRVVSARFRLVSSTGRVDGEQTQVDALAERIAMQPGVVSVVPEARAFAIRNVTLLPTDRGTGPRAAEAIRVFVEGAAPGYFGMLEVPIVLGRDISLADTTGDEYAIVIGSDLARAFWGGVSPIGRRITSVDWKEGARDSIGMEVIGVFDATHATSRGIGDRVYTANGRVWRKDALLVRTSGPAQALVPSMRELIRAQAPDVPVIALETLTDVGRRDRKEAWQVAGGAAAAGALALLLASIGLYAVVSLAVGQRRREIGIRIALGGRPSRVAAMFFASGVRLTAIALVIGLPLSVLGLRFVATRMVAPNISMPQIGLGIALVVLGVASAATWFPAQKAATIDPSLALRSE